MHLPDAVLAPSVALAAGVAGAAGFGLGLRKLERQAGEKTVVLMGMTSAFLFAAQMVNFPVFPGVSGHLLGGTLASVLLGPWAGSCVIGTVLIVQCLLFGDGGLTALGANFVNMGLIGAIGGYAIYAPLRRLIGGGAGVVFASTVAAWLSVVLASAAVATELAIGGSSRFLPVLGWMALVHAAIGVGEAIITGMIVQSVLLIRPDLIYAPERPARGTSLGQIAVAGLALSLAVAIFVAPFASEWPDGLEHVGERLGFVRGGAEPVVSGVLPDYSWPILGSHRLRVATAAAGAVGTVAVCVVGLVLAVTFARRPAAKGLNDAA